MKHCNERLREFCDGAMGRRAAGELLILCPVRRVLEQLRANARIFLWA